ncbi:MAG: helix-turn-helix domain-containing protein [Selenomonadaceae bacterium]|nr:helix-turn-helix domain-containing protein [Selenomonadaceae bacterium]
MKTGERIKNVREDRDILQQEMADAIGMNVSVLSRIENGTRQVRDDELVKIADKLNVTTDYLLGRDNQGATPDKLPELTKKDEREIESDLEDMMHSMASAAYNSQNEEEDVEAFKATLRSAMIQAKRMAKKKYTPKKYRRD